MRQMRFEFDNYYIRIEPQASFNRIEVMIAYDLLEGLYDSILFYENGKMKYNIMFCHGSLDIEEIKRKWG